MKKLLLASFCFLVSFSAISSVSAFDLSGVTDSFSSAFNGADVNDLDTECMLDILNDRFGVDAGTPFKLLGKGTELLGKGAGALGLDGVAGGIGKAGGALGGVGDRFSGVDLNDMGLDDVMNIINPGNKPVFDGPGLRRGARIVKCNIDRGISTEEDLNILILGWVNFVLQIVAVIAIVVIIYAGFLYISSGGDDAEKPKKIIMYVVIGIILIMGAYAIVNTFIGASHRSSGDEITDLETTPDPYYGAFKNDDGDEKYIYDPDGSSSGGTIPAGGKKMPDGSYEIPFEDSPEYSLNIKSHTSGVSVSGDENGFLVKYDKGNFFLEFSIKKNGKILDDLYPGRTVEYNYAMDLKKDHEHAFWYYTSPEHGFFHKIFETADNPYKNPNIVKNPGVGDFILLARVTEDYDESKEHFNMNVRDLRIRVTFESTSD